MELEAFQNLHLGGGFHFVRVAASHEGFVDPIGRPALARTSIIGHRIEIVISDGMTEHEQSVTLYHEVIEAATVAAPAPPASVMELNEKDFETIAHQMHERFGPATPLRLNRMLEMFGFASSQS